MLKKVFAVMLAFTMVLIMAGCGDKEQPQEPAKEDSTPAGETAATPAPESTAPATEAPAQTAMKIAIVTSPSGVDDGSFNQNVYEGIQAFIANHPEATVKAVNEPTGDNTASVQAVADIVADYDVIVTPGFQFAGIGQLAQDNPNVKFILVDSYPADAEGKEAEMDNVYAMQ